jgi:peptidoglycan/LPS O-acetylase OafA/YrhL
MRDVIASDPARWPANYELLDGLRGLAAMAVVGSHLGVLHIGHSPVMMFFVLSGYCITASAEASRRTGLSVRQFLWRRLRRIYPPYLCAIAFFACTRLLKAALGGPNTLARPAIDWIQNLTMTQGVTMLFTPGVGPVDNPTLVVAAFWTLGYELQFYLVIGLCMLLVDRLRIPLAWPMLALGAIGLIWNLTWPGGWVVGVFIEYWLHFALGACLYFVLCLSPSRYVQVVFVTSLAALGIMGAMRLDLQAEVETRVYFELAVSCAFVLVLLVLRPVSAAVSRAWWWQPVAALGTVSYSLYLVHQFNITLANSVADLLPAPDAVRVVLMLAVHVAIATVFWRFCERPFLNRPVPLVARHLP